MYSHEISTIDLTESLMNNLEKKSKTQDNGFINSKKKGSEKISHNLNVNLAECELNG